MRLTKTIAFSIVLIIFSILSSCETSDISEVSNKMPIEIRAIGTIENEDAKREIGILLKGVNLADKFFVPIISVTDITYSTDSLKLKTSQIKIPLSLIDAYSIGLTDEILDQSTYDDNLEDAELEKDSAYLYSIKILSDVRGSFVNRKYLPSDPIKENEFYIGNSSAIKTDTFNHIFRTSEDLLNYLKSSKRNYTKLILFFMGGKSMDSFIDSDRDSVMNDKDKCPTVKGSVSCEGCVCPPTIKNPPPPGSGPQGPTRPPINCGSCGDLKLKVNSSNTKQISWNSCPSARFIHIYVNSSKGNISKSVKINGNSTQYDLSNILGVIPPDIAMMEKFTITIKAECGSGQIIQTSSQVNVKIKCS